MTARGRGYLRPIRQGWLLPAAMVVLLGASGISVASVATSSRTETHIYRAFKASGAPAIRVTKTVRGPCFSGSDATDRDDAWRCASGNFLYDPCFSSDKAKGIVLCPAAAWARSGIEIKLTKPLPQKYRDKHKPSTSMMPWTIETKLGSKCAIDTGATWVFHDLRANYGCRSDEWLYGSPDRKHEPWTIHAGPAHPKKLHTVAIKVAWF